MAGERTLIRLLPAVDLAGLGLFTLFVAWRFLFHDVFYPNIDTVTHYRWAAQFAAEINSGVWRPRWTPLGHDGLGEPAFLYYPPLFYYCVAAAKRLTTDTWAAMKLVV